MTLITKQVRFALILLGCLFAPLIGCAQLAVTNGDFSLPVLLGTDEGDGITNISDWYNPTNVAYLVWLLGPGRVVSDPPIYTASESCEFGIENGVEGWAYTCLGAYHPTQGTNLDWSFTQVSGAPVGGSDPAGTGFSITFYAQTGAFAGTDTNDIEGASGVTAITRDPLTNFNSLDAASALAGSPVLARIDSGALNLSSLSNGTFVWLRLAATGADTAGANGFAAIDNVTVSQNFGDVAPDFTVNPIGMTNYTAYTVTLISSAKSSLPVLYQWYEVTSGVSGLVTNLIAAPDGTNADLTLNDTTTNTSGIYFVVASNSLGSATSSNALVSILARPPSLYVVNGNFETPAFGAGSTSESLGGIGVYDWFSPTLAFQAFIIGSGQVVSAPLYTASQACEFGPEPGFIYQFIGNYDPSQGTNLDWTFTQVETGDNSAGFEISFYAQTGAFSGTDTNDIEGASGVSPIGNDPLAVYNSLETTPGLLAQINNGSLALSSLAPGTPVWIRIAATGPDGIGDGYAAIDNVAVFQNSGNMLQFLVDPINQTNYTLYDVSLGAFAIDSLPAKHPVHYQWYYVSPNGLVTNLIAAPAGTNDILVLNEVSTNDTGFYHVTASNALLTSNSTSEYVQILARPTGMSTVNGDFEIPAFGTASQNQSANGIGVVDWYSPTAGYAAWQLGSGRVVQASQAVEFAPGTGWIYQALGTYNAGNGTNLNWSFQQDTDTSGGNSADFAISFYYSTGTNFVPAQGTDMSGAAGVTEIGSNAFDSLYDAGLQYRVNTGIQALSGVPIGAVVWVRIANTGQDGPNGGGYAPVDNVIVSENFGNIRPSFIVNPIAQTDYVLYDMSNSVSLTATTDGSPPVNYQWYEISPNGLTSNAVVGATNSTLTLSNPSPTNSGYYYVNASNAYGSTNSAPVDVQILPRPGLTTVNGDFEIPAFGAGSQNQSANGIGVVDWYSPTVGYDAWQLGSGRVAQVSQATEFAPGTGWIYQALGIYDSSNGTNLNWSFQQDTDGAGGNSADFAISFYYSTGTNFAPAQGTDINGAAGVTEISSNAFDSLYDVGLQYRVNTGVQDLSGVPSGALVWVRIANTGQDGQDGGGYAPVDNVFVSQIPVELSVSPIVGGQFQVQWNYYYGTMLSATNVTGPWVAVVGAVSPYTVTPSAAPSQFYKVSIP